MKGLKKYKEYKTMLSILVKLKLLWFRILPMVWYSQELNV
jgi:hypothetical protein